MIGVVQPLTYGWLQNKLNDKEMDYLWRCIKNKKEDHRGSLAGNVSGSYGLIDRGDWFFTNTLQPLCIKYAKEFGNIAHTIPTTCSHPLCLSKWWVNYQKKHEFNPSHDHGGVYSFVIWMKIPTDYREQKKLPIAIKANSSQISNFEFTYTDILGNILSYTYKMSPKDEGTMLFFPSKLRHEVYPFYNCDEDRISISGNITLNTSKKT